MYFLKNSCSVTFIHQWNAQAILCFQYPTELHNLMSLNFLRKYFISFCIICHISITPFIIILGTQANVSGTCPFIAANQI
jgi:hypothetical protein